MTFIRLPLASSLLLASATTVRICLCAVTSASNAGRKSVGAFTRKRASSSIARSKGARLSFQTFVGVAALDDVTVISSRTGMTV